MMSMSSGSEIQLRQKRCMNKVMSAACVAHCNFFFTVRVKIISYAQVCHRVAHVVICGFQLLTAEFPSVRIPARNSRSP